jgi:hypothetical protein
MIISMRTNDGNNFVNLLHLFPGLADLTIDPRPFYIDDADGEEIVVESEKF